MKYSFLLDENILYFAVKGVDEHENEDFTAAELLQLIAQNCHKITVSPEIVDRYWHHLPALLEIEFPIFPAQFFITQFMKNSAKVSLEYAEPAELPADADIPQKDIDIVRAALISRSVIITGDAKLRDAVNGQPALNLQALRPKEAIPLASKQ